jgi:carbonic anhydrase
MAVALTLATACKREPSEPEGSSQPSAEQESGESRSTMPGLDHGLVQSPVNILSKKTEGGKHHIAVNLHHAEPNHLENKGHTIELDFPRGSTLSFEGREYGLRQLHFHTPSEHQIDGVTYPMEGHVVNMIEPETPDDPPRYLVIAFLYRMGDESAFIKSFLDQVPSEVGGKALEPGQVHLGDAGQQMQSEYYHYRGSLTTPPYTETVEWLISKEILEASPEQIRRIHGIEGDNARHVQPLYGRSVEK